jgi:choline/glycine/proline betaine transport protein
MDFLSEVAEPALGEVRSQIEQRGLSAELHRRDGRVELTIAHGDQGLFGYSVRVRGFKAPSFAWAETDRMSDTDQRHYRALAQSSEGDQPHDVTGFARGQLINDFLTRYAHFRQARRLE